MSHRPLSVRDQARGVLVLLVAGALSLPLLFAAGGSSSARDVADAVVALARAQVGDRYQYGGTGPDAWDCSGLTSYVWHDAGGVTLPRVADDQLRAVVALPREQLLPADLVFFGDPVTHVALYVGDGRVVDAGSVRTGVSERPLWSEPVVRYGRVPRDGMPAVQPWTPPSPSPTASSSPPATPTTAPSAQPSTSPATDPGAGPATPSPSPPRPAGTTPAPAATPPSTATPASTPRASAASRPPSAAPAAVGARPSPVPASPSAAATPRATARPAATGTPKAAAAPSAGPRASASTSPRPTATPTGAVPRPAATPQPSATPRRTPAAPAAPAPSAAALTVRPLTTLPATQAQPSSRVALAAVALLRAQLGTTAGTDVSVVRSTWSRAGGPLLPASRSSLVARGLQVARPDVRVGDLVAYATPATQVYLYAGKGFMVGRDTEHGAVVVRRVHTGDLRFLRLPG